MKSNILLVFLLSATNIFAQIQTTNIVQQTTEDEAYITYNLGDEVVEGTLPPAETLNIGDTLVILIGKTGTVAKDKYQSSTSIHNHNYFLEQ